MPPQPGAYILAQASSFLSPASCRRPRLSLSPAQSRRHYAIFRLKMLPTMADVSSLGRRFLKTRFGLRSCRLNELLLEEKSFWAISSPLLYLSRQCSSSGCLACLAAHAKFRMLTNGAHFISLKFYIEFEFHMAI